MIKLVTRLLIASSLALFAAPSAAKAAEALKTFQTGPLPIKLRSPLNRKALQEGMLVVRGHVSGNQNIHLVIRIDDGNSHDYHSRFNKSWVMTPGNFTIRMPLTALRTSAKEPLNMANIDRVIIFDQKRRGVTQIDYLAVEKRRTLPNGAVGFSFGKVDAPVFDGFQRVDAKDKRIQGSNLKEIHRQGADPLLASGINGIEKFSFKVTPGKYKLSLWTEEHSAWSNFRGFTERTIKANNKVLSAEKYTPTEWINRFYMARRDLEVGRDKDIWDLYGKHRGGLKSFEVAVGADRKLTLEIKGKGPVSNYLSALLLEPLGAKALEKVKSGREAWFRETWRVDQKIGELHPADQIIHLDEKRSVTGIQRALTPDHGTSFIVGVAARTQQKAPKITIDWVKPEVGKTFETMIWTGQRRLERVRVGGNLFAARASTLRRNLSKFDIKPDAPRRYTFWVKAGEDTPNGVHHANVVIENETGDIQEIPLTFYTPVIKTQKPLKPAGFYMAHTQHFRGHADLQLDENRQSACDLAFLNRLGIVGNAPAFHVPFAKGEDDFLNDMRSALQFAKNSPLLAYHAAFELYNQGGIDYGSKTLARSLQLLRDHNLPAPIWSMADEPNNPTAIAKDMPAWVAAVKKQAPQAKLAGHLNNPKDQRFLSLFDVAIINQGFGIDRKDINYLKKQGIEPWLYNTGRPRVTAGLWLWASGASHYLQWHGRLPIGHAFDPTDGREADVSMFPPMPEVCAKQPDINEFVLHMADGITDQKFFTWLAEQESRDAKSHVVALEFRHGGKWDRISEMSDKHLHSLRIAIAKLALRLNRSAQTN